MNKTIYLIFTKFYKTKIIEGQIKLNAHDKLAWIDPNDYSKFKLLPGDIPVLEKILSERY